ncbi:MAG TPA: phosphoglucosamine mutase [Bacteroidetes bacterium]|nr:phosphoglucosamine mutase [Bacteroidota bacterium]
MTLIASISGIRGTIGGESGENLTPIDIVNFTAAFGIWLTTKSSSRKMVIGRDARPSGQMVENLVTGTLMGLGFEVINLGLSTTPTVEMAIPFHDAAGGLVLTASHNPKEWNALKLLNSKGEFVTKKDGGEILDIVERGFFSFSLVEKIGKVTEDNTFWKEHNRAILALPLVDSFSISNSGLKVLVDGVNSTGGIYVPLLLKELGITDIVELNCVADGQFAHNPEPLQKNLLETCAAIAEHGCDLGIVVDPDVDRLVMIDEKGNLFGEEYTLVAVADYVLKHKPGVVVSNLSSSRALRDLAESYGCKHYASAVGEVNVTEIMKRYDAVIGGEGNGGVIFPALHYGRDALVGIALFLSHLVKSKMTCSELRATYPDYFMSKQKAALEPGIDVDAILESIASVHQDEDQNDIDGLKIDFAESWVHLRKSNTEPIIRIYSEAKTQAAADALADTFKAEILSHVNK